MSRQAFLLFVGLAATSRVHAQGVPLRAGHTVRLATADSAGPPLWQAGTVLAATRLGVLVRTRSRGDTLPVPFDGSVRVQLQRRLSRTFVLGGALGVAVGSLLGATALRSTFGASWGDAGVAGEVIAFGLLGGVVGAAVGLVARPARWDEIPLTLDGFPVAPLSRAPPRAVQFTRHERWREFGATEADFAGFFHHWQDSLEAVEGTWEFDFTWSGNAGRAPAAYPPRMAIVRDGRYAGYEFVAVALPPGGMVEATRSRYDGTILFAMRRARRPGVFEVRQTREGQAGNNGDAFGVSRDGWGAYGVEAEFLDGRLEFRYREHGNTVRWVKLPIDNR